MAALASIQSISVRPIDAGSYRQDRYADQAKRESTDFRAGVTELILSKECQQQAGLILPMLAFLSQQVQHQWITWVGPPHIDRQLLARHGVDLSKIRLIHTNHVEDILWMTWEALAAGTSHTVIASPGKLHDRQLYQLEAAAQTGQSQGLLLRIRN